MFVSLTSSLPSREPKNVRWTPAFSGWLPWASNTDRRMASGAIHNGCEAAVCASRRITPAPMTDSAARLTDAPPPKPPENAETAAAATVREAAALVAAVATGPKAADTCGALGTLADGQESGCRRTVVECGMSLNGAALCKKRCTRCAIFVISGTSRWGICGVDVKWMWSV
jgi:hypothetical protein